MTNYNPEGTRNRCLCRCWTPDQASWIPRIVEQVEQLTSSEIMSLAITDSDMENSYSFVAILNNGSTGIGLVNTLTSKIEYTPSPPVPLVQWY